MKKQALLIAGILMGLLLSGCLPAAAPSPAPVKPIAVKFGYQPQADWLFYTAKENGLFEKAGLAPEYIKFASGREMLAALGSKSIDVASFSAGPFLVGLAAGLDLRTFIVMEDGSNETGLVVRLDRGINTVADLKGKTIGYVKGSAVEWGMRKVLRQLNIDLKEVKLLDLAPGVAFAAFAKGEVDGVWTWNPWKRQMEAAGGKVIFKDGDVGVHVDGLWAGFGEWLDNNQEAARRLVEAGDLARQLIAKDPMIGKKAVAANLELTEDVANRIWEDAKVPTIQQLGDEKFPLNLVDPQGGWSKHLGDTADGLYELGQLSVRPDLGKAVDSRPLKAYLKR